MYAETVAGRQPISRVWVGAGGRYEFVLGYLDRLDAEARAIIAELTNTDLDRKCLTPAGVAITTWKWLRAMCEHEAHHRGQIYLMFGMIGVATQPLYGLTSEEVLERSADSAHDHPEETRS